MELTAGGMASEPLCNAGQDMRSPIALENAEWLHSLLTLLSKY